MSEKVRQAALWLATREANFNEPIVPVLKERFKLTALDATHAIVEANLIRRSAH